MKKCKTCGNPIKNPYTTTQRYCNTICGLQDLKARGKKFVVLKTLKPIPKKGKSERKKLIAKLDEMFSVYIRNRDKNICFTCGTKDNPTCGHLFSRSNYSTRWEELNAHDQCAGCNMAHEYHPETYTIKFIDKYGYDAYKNLEAKHRQTKKFTNEELKNLFNHYQEKLINLGGTKLPF